MGFWRFSCFPLKRSAVRLREKSVKSSWCEAFYFGRSSKNATTCRRRLMGDELFNTNTGEVSGCPSPYPYYLYISHHSDDF